MADLSPGANTLAPDKIWKRYIETKYRREYTRMWRDYIQPRISTGSHAYLISFAFDQIPGHRNSVIHEMQGVVGRFYATLARGILPESITGDWVDYLPILIGIPDLTGGGPEGAEIREVPGFPQPRFNALILTPPGFPPGLEDVLARYLADERQYQRSLTYASAKTINSDPQSAIDHPICWIQTGGLNIDDILMFPGALFKALRKSAHLREGVALSGQMSGVSIPQPA